jgi:hypothetical protein
MESSIKIINFNRLCELCAKKKKILDFRPKEGIEIYLTKRNTAQVENAIN